LRCRTERPKNLYQRDRTVPEKELKESTWAPRDYAQKAERNLVEKRNLGNR